MRKLIATALSLFLYLTPLFAWEGSSWSGGQFSSGLIGTGYINGGVSNMAAGVLAIPLNYGVVSKTITSASDEAGTLANGLQGQMLKIILATKGSSGNFVLTPTTKTGYATITFNSAGDQATLLFVDNTAGWIIVGETGTAVGQ